MKPCIRRAWFWLANVALAALLAVACTNRTPQATLPNLSTATLTPGQETSGPADAPLSTPVVSTALPALESPTPTDTVTPTATSTPTSTPTPSPTPTPLPDVRLHLGRSFWRQGNCTAALEHFVALLADPATEADVAAEAHYRSAQCHALNDDPAAAVAAFQEFLKAYPDDPRRPAAHFQLAEAHAALKEWEAAIENYQVYLNDQDAIASAVYERIGDAYVQLSEDDQAIESYQTALENAPYLDQAFALREKVAEIHLRHGDYELAIDQYAKILETAQLDAYRAQIEYLLGQTYLLADDAETAYRHWLAAVDRYPRAHHAYLSLVELVNAGVKVDEYQRGIVDFYAGVYGPAEQAFYRYLESDATERRDLARYYIGRAYHLSGNYQLATDEYEIIIEAYPNNPVAADAWLEKARSMAAQGRVDEAIDTLHSFVETHPDHESAPLALWRVAQLHENAAAWIEAAATYRRLTQDYPASEQAVAALFRAGLSHFRQADYQAAAEDWQKLVTDYADWPNLSAAQYWLGTTYAAQNNHDEANKWLTAAAESDAFLPSYYALRARHRAKVSAADPGVTSTQTAGDWPLAQPNLLLEQDETAAQAEAEAWLLSWADPGEEANDLTMLTDTLTQDPRHQRGVAYLSVGFDQEAINEFEIMRQAWEDDPLAMYRLALTTRELGVYKTSIRCALRVAELSPAPTIGDTPHFLQRLVYPTYFDDLVLPEAAANDLDPLLVFALIRQESLFESSARSYAQAIGLMQIIPSTGEWIAHRLDWSDFAPTHLTRPYLNVRFGTWYLAQGLNTFQGDLFAALAAYNSGLASPSRWLDAAGGDPDLFVETIDYSQTRHYVQTIYQQHALYRQIYQPQ